jgi:hypothetical protein
LQLLLEDRFPQIWVPSWENRDLRQLLWHRHRMVQARTRIMNQLQAVALNEGLRCRQWRPHLRQTCRAREAIRGYDYDYRQPRSYLRSSRGTPQGSFAEVSLFVALWSS